MLIEGLKTGDPLTTDVGIATEITKQILIDKDNQLHFQSIYGVLENATMISRKLVKNMYAIGVKITKTKIKGWGTLNL